MPQAVGSLAVGLLRVSIHQPQQTWRDGRLCRRMALYPEELWIGKHRQHKNEGRECSFCFFINSYNSPSEQWEELSLPGQQDPQPTECAAFSKLISFALKKKKICELLSPFPTS